MIELYSAATSLHRKKREFNEHRASHEKTLVDLKERRQGMDKISCSPAGSSAVPCVTWAVKEIRMTSRRSVITVDKIKMSKPCQAPLRGRGYGSGDVCSFVTSTSNFGAPYRCFLETSRGQWNSAAYIIVSPYPPIQLVCSGTLLCLRCEILSRIWISSPWLAAYFHSNLLRDLIFFY